MAPDDDRLRVLYDGQCSLCRQQRRSLEKRDDRGRLDFVDIHGERFDPKQLNVDPQAVHREMHVVKPDGTVLRAMDAVRAVYRAVGRGWLVAPTRWPLLRPLFDALYRLIARYRPRGGGPGTPHCRDGACRTD